MEPIRRPSSTGHPGEELARLELPETMRAAVVRKDEVDMFEGVATADKDPRKSCTSTRCRSRRSARTRC
jgi:hypothetical protein